MTAPARNQTARERLGEVIRFHREQRNLTARDVSRRAKVSIAQVESWEAGREVPGGEEWRALCSGIHRSLHAYQELHTRAREEARIERETVTNAFTGTNLGAKLRVAIAEPAPAPAPVQLAPIVPIVPTPPPAPEKVTVQSKQLPPGWKSERAVQERRDWAKGILRMRPNIRIHGADSLDELMKARYGVGVSHDVASELRAELRAEQAPAPTPTEPAPAPTPPMRAAPTPAPEPTRPVSSKDIEAAVDLVIAAVPNLRSFTITIDDAGAAHVAVKLREIVVRESEVVYVDASRMGKDGAK